MQSPGGSAIRAAALVCAVLLAGCAGVQRETQHPPVTFAAARNAFDVTGRLSLRKGSEALTGSFHWQHQPENDQIDLVSPTGQTLARLRGSRDFASLQMADGRIETAANWDALTARELDWSLPVSGLAFWIQGVPRPGSTFAAETESGDEPKLLRQDGWTILYQAFAPDNQGVARPARMVLSYPEVELRMAVDAWQ
ncbi:MAG: outer membrane lipoprotein LolB [Betaproteobacteria bacterium]|nr:MAG: outer membrane lipoprotein LolB [Betaproteobacteria bacterium]